MEITTLLLTLIQESASLSDERFFSICGIFALWITYCLVKAMR